MASGFPEAGNKSSDLIYSHSHITGSPQQADSNLQYFWEAFPAGAGPTARTTYMFAYMDAGAVPPLASSLCASRVDPGTSCMTSKRIVLAVNYLGSRLWNLDLHCL